MKALDHLDTVEQGVLALGLVALDGLACEPVAEREAGARRCVCTGRGSLARLQTGEERGTDSSHLPNEIVSLSMYFSVGATSALHCSLSMQQSCVSHIMILIRTPRYTETTKSVSKDTTG